MSVTKISFPNEILLQVCKSLDPYDFNDHNTLLTLRAVCRAFCEYATPAAFKMWRLGGGRSQETASRQVVLLSARPGVYPLMKHIDFLAIDIDSMLPSHRQEQGGDQLPVATKTAKDHTYWTFQSTTEDSTHEYSKKFYALLREVFALCGGKLKTIRISDCTRRFPPRGEHDPKGALAGKLRILAECFWVVIRLTVRSQPLRLLQSLELRLVSMSYHSPFSHLLRVPASNLVTAITGSDWGSDFHGGDQDTENIFARVSNWDIAVRQGRKDGRGVYNQTVLPGYRQWQQDSSFYGHFLSVQPLSTLQIDFGYLHLREMEATDFLSLASRTKYRDLTSLSLRHFVEGDLGYLRVFLQWCKALQRLELVECAIVVGGYKKRTWSHIFSRCLLLEHLHTIYFDRLYYFPRGPDPRPLSKVQGWTCGLPVYSNRVEDLETLDSLQRDVAKRGEEAGVANSLWMDKFLRNPECWDVVRPDGSILNYHSLGHGTT